MLTKDDVVYYKTQFNKILKDAKNNNIIVEIKNNIILFKDEQTGEITSVVVD